MKKILIKGNKLGIMNNPEKGIKEVSVIHVVEEFRPDGPAENSIIKLTTSNKGITKATYTSWVGYFDLDQENTYVKEKWTILEPANSFQMNDVIWKPFSLNRSKALLMAVSAFAS